MSLGFSVPVKTDVSGGAEKQRGSSQTKKLLKLALGEGDDSNPFQDLGIRPTIIFAVNNTSSAAEMKLEIQRILKKFSDRLTLDESNPIRFSVDNPGELTVSFGYVDKETNKKEEFKEVFARAGGQRG